jgi:hypothetical protein
MGWLAVTLDTTPLRQLFPAEPCPRGTEARGAFGVHIREGEPVIVKSNGQLAHLAFDELPYQNVVVSPFTDAFKSAAVPRGTEHEHIHGDLLRRMRQYQRSTHHLTVASSRMSIGGSWLVVAVRLA